MQFNKKEVKEGSFAKKTGIFESRVIAINPDLQKQRELFGGKEKEDEEETDYVTTNDDGKKQVRLTFVLEDVLTKWKTQLSFYLVNEKAFNKNGDKKIYVSQVGENQYVTDSENLFITMKNFVNNFKDKTPIADKEYKHAIVGEKEYMNFMRSWLCNCNLNGPDNDGNYTNFLFKQADIDKLFSGDFNDLQKLVGSELTGTVIVAAHVTTEEKDGNLVQKQRIYKYAFCPGVDMYGKKNMPLINIAASSGRWSFSNKEYDVKKFIGDISDKEYGINKGSYKLETLRDFVAGETIDSSNDTIRHSEEEVDMNYDASE